VALIPALPGLPGGRRDGRNSGLVTVVLGPFRPPIGPLFGAGSTRRGRRLTALGGCGCGAGSATVRMRAFQVGVGGHRVSAERSRCRGGRVGCGCC
jgi:hypothetical protein